MSVSVLKLWLLAVEVTNLLVNKLNASVISNLIPLVSGVANIMWSAKVNISTAGVNCATNPLIASTVELARVAVA